MSDCGSGDAQQISDVSGGLIHAVLSLISSYLLDFKAFLFETDWQLKILVFLLGWLCLNLILISVAWKVYGESLTDTFTKQGSTSEEDTKEGESPDKVHRE